MGKIYKTSVATAALERVAESSPSMGLSMLREDSGGEGMLHVGICEIKPGLMDYTFPADETLYVFDGDVDVQIGSESVSLTTGDLASFWKGDQSIWTIHQKLRGVFVLSS
jgi:uncharacterized cupin superfamily protein